MTVLLVLALALMAISWSAILIRLCEAPALGIAFYRLLFATLGTLPLMWRRSESRRRWHSALSLPALIAGAFLAVHFASWIKSLELTSVASSVLLVNLHPLLSAYAGQRWLGEPVLATLYAAVLFSERPVAAWYAGAIGVAAGIGWMARQEWVRARRLHASN